ncbi:unnamed protein product [Didymodactylos carnosus]|uniref:B box-type domain-containing protein n=1 Tax=Didymodactylos carnosus TaxID=1234261 RepID=A0A815H103_9BILA|nr:unnamed protein product [Didymodactylos carnosus]CAF4211360.1 unnamed protein product [Didymodactylos carnosus]
MTNETLCFMCNKTQCIIQCSGCDLFYCRRCFNNHRQHIENDFVHLYYVERDQFQYEMNIRLDESKNVNQLLNAVDVWEHETIIAVRKSAQKARLNVQNSTEIYHTTIRTNFNQFTNELSYRHEHKDYTERTIAQLYRQLNELKTSTSRPTKLALKPILQTYGPEQKTFRTTDTSGYAFGTILSQVDKSDGERKDVNDLEDDVPPILLSMATDNVGDADSYSPSLIRSYIMNNKIVNTDLTAKQKDKIMK